jgi:hypothetical protein
MRERGEGTAVANFVTFGDKLGHTSSCVAVSLYANGLLPCEIKALERKLAEGFVGTQNANNRIRGM